MNEGERNMCWFCGGLLLLIPAAIIVDLVAGSTWGAVVGSGGTIVWMTLTMAWVVLVDSRKRWLADSAWQRFINVITFRR